MAFFMRNSTPSQPMSCAMSPMRHSAVQMPSGTPYARMAPVCGPLVWTVHASQRIASSCVWYSQRNVFTEFRTSACPWWM